MFSLVYSMLNFNILARNKRFLYLNYLHLEEKKNLLKIWQGACIGKHSPREYKEGAFIKHCFFHIGKTEDNFEEHKKIAKAQANNLNSHFV